MERTKQELVMLCCIISHGNAFLERGMRIIGVSAIIRSAMADD
jgi:hypothetical protein